MNYQLFKLDLEKLNSVSRYRLVVVSESVDVVFTYRTFRTVLEDLQFSAHRIGYVVKLINQNFPYEVPFSEKSIDDKYSDKVLKDFAEFHGFKVSKLPEVNLLDAIRVLKLRGYTVVADFISDKNIHVLSIGTS